MSTREKILLTATEVFCQKGFNEAGVKEISEKAHVNLAAISYHFGGKAELYKAVIEDLLLDGAVPPTPSLECPLLEGMEGMIKSLLAQIKRNRGLLSLVQWESVAPTGLMTEKLNIHIKEGHLRWVSWLVEKAGCTTEQANIALFSLFGILTGFTKKDDWMGSFLPNMFVEGELTENGEKILTNELSFWVASYLGKKHDFK